MKKKRKRYHQISNCRKSSSSPKAKGVKGMCWINKNKKLKRDTVELNLRPLQGAYWPVGLNEGPQSLTPRPLSGSMAAGAGVSGLRAGTT